MRVLQKAVLLLLLFSCVQKTGSEIRVEEAASQQETIRDIPPTGIENKCSYENETSTLGMGLVLAPSGFALYNDSLLTDEFAGIDIYRDQAAFSRICPKFFMPDYGIMHFVCVDSTANAYQILTDFSSVKFIEKDSGAEFTTWENYILRSFGIRRLAENKSAAPVQDDLRVGPSEDSEVLAIPEGFEMFCPMEIRDHWVKVKYDCFYNTDENPHEGEPCYNFIGDCKDPLTGWLKWREGNKVLIDIFLIP